MADGKIFTKQTKKFLSDVLCEEIKFKGFIKLIKRQIVNTALNLADKYGDKYIPDRFDPKIDEVAVLCGNGEWIEAAEVVGKVADGELNLPGDKSTQTKMIVNGFMFGASIVLNWIENKKKQFSFFHKFGLIGQIEAGGDVFPAFVLYNILSDSDIVK